jgi:transcription antitermination factor NusG
MPEFPASRWFALVVKPRHDKAVEQNLRFRDLEAFAPLYPARRCWSDRVKTVELPLFPGYVFCRFSVRNRIAVLNTPGVVSIVGFAKADTPIEDSEISAIQAVLRSGLPVQPWPYIRPGARVRIHDGALGGVEGTLLREKGAWQVVLSVELLQRSVAVEIDRVSVSALDASPLVALPAPPRGAYSHAPR